MPELPEVERVRAGVANEATGKVITSITTSHPRATNARSLTALSSLRSAVIHKVNRRGKFIFFELDRPEYLVAHLGMSGRFHFRSPTTPVELHQRATLTLTGLAEQTQLRFIDPRTFGWLAVCLGTDGLPQLLANVAKDPFDPTFTPDPVVAEYLRHSAQIKTLLLDQSIMSGVGNIYADESLWMSSIHPQTPANSLPPHKLLQLVTNAKAVMLKSLLSGGTTFDGAYRDVKDAPGRFSKNLSVYGLTGRPCPRCGSAIIRIPFGSRSSHLCPHCQQL